MGNYRLPETEAAHQALATTIGADGQQLLGAVDAAKELPELGQMPTVRALRQVWAGQYVTEDRQMRLGSAAELPPLPSRSAPLMIQRPATAKGVT